MALHRQRIEIHSGLDGEIYVDTAQAIGELVIAGKSYGFEWTKAGLAWDKEPPYRTVMAETTALVESFCC